MARPGNTMSLCEAWPPSLSSRVMGSCCITTWGTGGSAHREEEAHLAGARRLAPRDVLALHRVGIRLQRRRELRLKLRWQAASDHGEHLLELEQRQRGVAQTGQQLADGLVHGAMVSSQNGEGGAFGADEAVVHALALDLRRTKLRERALEGLRPPNSACKQPADSLSTPIDPPRRWQIFQDGRAF